MDRHAAALVLDEIATLLAITGGDRFRVRAYRGAANALESAHGDLAELIQSGELARLRGIGAASLSVVRELVETGESSMHARLRAKTPLGILELLEVPGLGAGRVAKLHEALGIGSLADLESAARDGRIATVRGFGPKTQASILEGIAYVRGAAGRRPLFRADQAARRVIGALVASDAVARTELAGELRRRCETVDGIDLVVAAADDDCEAAMAAVRGLPGVREAPEVRERGAGTGAGTGAGAGAGAPHFEGVLADGFRVRAWCVEGAAFATTLLYATGADAHVHELEGRAAQQGLELTSAALRRKGRRRVVRDEARLYRSLELAWVPPELREGRGEVAAAARDRLPELVEVADLRGTFHCHTTYSDGKASVAEMARAARAKGWRYLGISDHSKAAFYAGGLASEDLTRQHAEIDAWNAKHGDELRLLRGIEADILPDGRVDFADEPGVLESLDFVIASVHGGFRASRADNTRRIVRAVSDPRVRILGHATGRLLLSRKGYDVDLDAVLEAAAEHDVIVELNADPWRLDLAWTHWPRAKALGVRTAINPDAHSTRGLDNVAAGVDQARKGWLEAEDVVNTWELERVLALFSR